MRAITSLLIIACAATSGITAEVASGPNSHTNGVAALRILCHSDGSEILFTVTEEDFFSTGYWQPLDGNPPLSARKAEQLATQRFTEHVKDYQHWELEQITLRHAGDGLHWVYQVEYRDRRNRHGAPFAVLVRLDGQVARVEITKVK